MGVLGVHNFADVHSMVVVMAKYNGCCILAIGRMVVHDAETGIGRLQPGSSDSIRLLPSLDPIG